MKKTNLTRREFLKVAGISAGIVTAYPLVNYAKQFFPEIRFRNRLFRGTMNGIIQSSIDEGQTWEKMMNFGSSIQVVDFKINENSLIAKLKLGKHDFLVESVEGLIWKTI